MYRVDAGADAYRRTGPQAAAQCGAIIIVIYLFINDSAKSMRVSVSRCNLIAIILYWAVFFYWHYVFRLGWASVRDAPCTWTNITVLLFHKNKESHSRSVSSPVQQQIHSFVFVAVIVVAVVFFILIKSLRPRRSVGAAAVK